MAIRRVVASVEVSRSRTTAAGHVHRVSEVSLDLTEAVFRQPVARIRQLRDSSREAIDFVQPFVDAGEVTDVHLSRSIMDCVGVSRLSAITEEDVWCARNLLGLVRRRN